MEKNSSNNNDSVRLKKKSWHFKLATFVYGRLAEHPYKTENFCLYFWMVMSCFLLLPFVTMVKIIILPHILMDKYFLRKYEMWLEGLTSEQIMLDYEIYDYKIRKPFRYRKYQNRGMLGDWFMRKFGQSLYTPEGNKIFEDLSKEEENSVIKWREIKAAEDKATAERYKKKQERAARIEAKFNKITTLWDILIKKLSIDFSKLSNIVKWTKRMFGLIITGTILGVIYFIVSWSSQFILWLTEIITHEHLMWALAIVTVISVLVGLGVGLWYIIKSIGNWLYNLFTIKSDSTLANVLLYLIVYPIKYVVWYPIKFIFYHFLWKLICIRIIAGLSVAIWNALFESSGIFGEYFRRSKGDMCPVIEWVDDNE
jgi:hypothetical protein